MSMITPLNLVFGSLVSKLVLPGPQALHALQENLGPIIRERRQQVQKYEEANEIWYDKPVRNLFQHAMDVS